MSWPQKNSRIGVIVLQISVLDKKFERYAHIALMFSEIVK